MTVMFQSKSHELHLPNGTAAELLTLLGIPVGIGTEGKVETVKVRESLEAARAKASGAMLEYLKDLEQIISEIETHGGTALEWF